VGFTVGTRKTNNRISQRSKVNNDGGKEKEKHALNTVVRVLDTDSFQQLYNLRLNSWFVRGCVFSLESGPVKKEGEAGVSCEAVKGL
jgi:hypothetical protein